MTDETAWFTLRLYADGLVKRAQAAEARVAKLELEIADWKAGAAAEALEADRGRTRVAELERREEELLTRALAAEQKERNRS